MNNIEKFASSAINIIIQDIMELDIIIPRLIFDYSINTNINQGYYMYQNTTGDIITLNMNSILALKEDNDIKTVITYGFIHEICHMYQNINSDYFKDSIYHNLIEDVADYDTIKYIRENIDLIQKRLHFEFNDIFLKGIERQLQYKISGKLEFDDRRYIIKSITGALCSKMNINFDNIYKILLKNNYLKIIFPDKREYYISLQGYNPIQDLNLLINLIYLTDFKFIYIQEEEYVGYPKVIIFYLY